MTSSRLSILLRSIDKGIWLDLGLIAAVFAAGALGPFDGALRFGHAALVAAVYLRVFERLLDWFYAPRRLNAVWHRRGRGAGTGVLNRVVRLYGLETNTPVTPFEGTLGHALYHARQDFPGRIGLEAAPTAIDAVSETVHGFWIPVDRSRTLPSPGLRMAVLDPIPAIDGDPGSFEDICRHRAAALLAEDKPISLFWSGGIDSTAALSALIMQADRSGRERIEVFLRPRSIAEYPAFFERFVRPLRHTIIGGADADRFASGPARTFSSDVGPVLADAAGQSLAVTGEHGDQVFGSIKLAENPDWIGRPAAAFLDDPRYRPHRDQIEALNAAAPMPITTIDSLLWWWNFAVKWQEITFRSLSDVADGAAFANVRHFFQTAALLPAT